MAIAQGCAQFLAGTVEARAHGAVGHTQRLGDLLVGEVSQGHQEEYVPVAGGQLRQSRAEPWPHLAGQDACRDPVLGPFRIRIRRQPGMGPVSADLVPAVAAHEPGRDAVEPGPRRSSSGIEPGPFSEGHEKRLRRDVVGRVGTEPPVHIPVDLGEVVIEDPGEPLRLRAGRVDEPGVVVWSGMRCEGRRARHMRLPSIRQTPWAITVRG
jgi:hypothetical protein